MSRLIVHKVHAGEECDSWVVRGFRADDHNGVRCLSHIRDSSIVFVVAENLILTDFKSLSDGAGRARGHEMEAVVQNSEAFSVVSIIRRDEILSRDYALKDISRHVDCLICLLIFDDKDSHLSRHCTSVHRKYVRKLQGEDLDLGSVSG